jgi:hypothetical protein
MPTLDEEFDAAEDLDAAFDSAVSLDDEFDAAPEVKARGEAPPLKTDIEVREPDPGDIFGHAAAAMNGGTLPPPEQLEEARAMAEFDPNAPHVKVIDKTKPPPAPTQPPPPEEPGFFSKVGGALLGSAVGYMRAPEVALGGAVSNAFTARQTEKDVDEAVIKPLQENVGAPLASVQRGLHAQNVRDIAGVVGMADEAELLHASSMEWAAGEKFAETSLSPEVLASARARLPTWNLPILGEVRPAEEASRIAGNPTTFVPVPGTAAISVELKAFPLLSKVASFALREGVEGSLTGGLEGALDPQMGAVEGAVGGGILQPPMAAGLHGATKAVTAGAKKVAFVAREQLPQLASEVVGYFRAQTALAEQAFSLDQLKPSLAVGDIIDGKPAVIFTEIADGAAKQSAIILDSDKAVSKAAAILRQHDLPPLAFGDGDTGSVFATALDTDQYRALLDRNAVRRTPAADITEADIDRMIAKGEVEVTIKPDVMAVVDGEAIPQTIRTEVVNKKTGDVLYAGEAADDLGRAKAARLRAEKGQVSAGPDEATKPGPKRASKPPPPPPHDPDLPEEIGDADIVLVQENGHVKAEMLPPPAAKGDAIPKPGDEVMTSGGAQGTFIKFAKNGRAVVKVGNTVQLHSPLNVRPAKNEIVPNSPTVEGSIGAPREGGRPNPTLPTGGGQGGGGGGMPPNAASGPPPSPPPDPVPLVAHGPSISPKVESNFVPEGPLPAHVVEQLETASKLVAMMQRAGPGAARIWNAFKDLLVAPHAHGPFTKQTIGKQLMGARSLYVPDEFYKAFEKRMKANGVDVSPNSQFSKDLTKFMEGEVINIHDGSGAKVGERRIKRMNGAQMRLLHPQAWNALEDMARPLIERMENNSRELAAELGDAGLRYLNDLQKLRDAGLVELYVGRMYRAYQLKGKWHRLVPTEALRAGEDFIVRQLHEFMRRKPNDPLTKFLQQQNNLGEYVATKVMDVIKKDDPLEAFFNHETIGKPFKHLSKRLDQIPGPIKDLLGFETSGLLRLAHTLATQEYMLANIKIWNYKIAGDPTIFSPIKHGPFTVEVPNIPAKYGKAAGGFVTEDYRAFLSAPNMEKLLPEFIRSMMGHYKSMQIKYGGPGTWLNNFFGNPYFSVIAGGLDPLRPRESGRAWSMAWHILVSDKPDMVKLTNSGGAWDARPFDTKFRDRAPKELVGSAKKLSFFKGDFENTKVGQKAAASVLASQDDMAAVLLEARNMGIDSPGLAGIETGGKGGGRVVRALIDEMNKMHPDDSLWRKLARLKDRIGAMANAASDEMAHAYDLIDRTYKLANYISLRQKGLRKFDGNVEQSAAWAAQRIHRAFPDYRQMGHIPTAIANVAPVANAFVRFHLENMRIHTGLPVALAEDPSLLVRAGFFTAATISALSFMGMMRNMAGISDEEAEALKDNFTKRQRSFRPFVIVLPFRKENGEPAIVDLTPMIPLAIFAQGHPDDAIWQNVLGSAIQNLAGPIAEKPMADMLHDAGISRKMADYEMMESERGTVNWAKQMAAQYAAPGAMSRQWNYLEQANVVGDGRLMSEKMTTGDLVGRSAGVPFVPSSTPAQGDFSPNYVKSQREDLKVLRDNTKFGPLFKGGLPADVNDPAAMERWRQKRLEEVEAMKGRANQAGENLQRRGSINEKAQKKFFRGKEK